MSKGRLFVISGASGVGKGTVLKAVLARRPDVRFSVSATTRAPRPGEREGESYYFISEEQFRNMIAQDAFLEYDRHNETWYGTPLQQLEDKLEKGPVLLDIDPNGAFQVRRKRPDAVLVFLMPPSRAELERRLRSRGDTSPEQIRLRLERADWEMAQREHYDHILINDQADVCAQELLALMDGTPNG